MSPLSALLLDVLALVGGTVHPLTEGAEPAVATVLVEGGRIRAVGPDLAVPEGARVLDLTGLHIVPGLVDAVVSFEAEHDVLYLDAGVTLVRDHGSPYASLMREKDIALRDRNPGPYLLLSGPTLGGLAPARPDAVQLTNAAHVAQHLERTIEILAAAEVPLESLAIDASLDAAMLKVVGTLATRRDVSIFGPLPRGMAPAEARALGQRVIVGLDSLLPRGVTWQQEAELPDLGATVRALAEGGWRVAPLLGGTARILREPDEAQDAALLAQLSPTLEIAWLADAALFKQQLERGLDAPWRRALARQRDFVRALHAAGVQLIPASGAPSPWLPPGRALQLELAEWVAAGIPAADVLALATREAARALGHGERRGTVEVGRSADLLALGSDPRLGLAAFERPEVVIVRGRVLERPDLDALVEGLVAQQRAVRAELAATPVLPLPKLPEGDLVLSGQVETRAFGRRLTTERFGVVRLADGALAYGARVEVPPTASESGQRMHLVQVVREGVVESFELEVGPVEEGEPDLERLFGARGSIAPGTQRLTIERRLGRKRLDSVVAPERIGVVDMATSVTGLVIARHFPEEVSYALSFEGPTLETTMDRWRMRVRPEDRRIEVLTSRGFFAFGFDADGAPRFGVKQHGDAHLELAAPTLEVRGGAGFGLSNERVYRPEAAPEAKKESAGDGR